MKHQGSIKTRLIVIILVCILGMSILAANQIYNTQRLIKLNDHSRLLLKLNHELLQLRRHEKDFLLRKDTQYLDKFTQRTLLFSQSATQLQQFFDDSLAANQEFEEILQSFETYVRLFNELAISYKNMGLDENTGYQGEFRQATHQLENHLSNDNQTYLHLLLLQMRRHEKDFLLRQDLQYVEKQILSYQALGERLNNKPSNKLPIKQTQSAANQQPEQQLLDNYQQKFLQLVNTQKEIGLDHNSGLKGLFRQQAHQVEAQLTLLDTKIAALITAEESKIERTSFLIMTITLITLIILLVKSFITLQKAFSTFVMFFYRCKREYQHIDERKQGFAEFKYLAMIANEMIDARQEMEVELKKAQKEIQRLQAKQEPDTSTHTVLGK